MKKKEYEPYGVYVVIKSREGIIVEKKENTLSLPFTYGIKGETAQKCAKDLIESITTLSPRFIKALPYVKREEISSVPSSVKENWPKGAKTFPVYAFLFETEEKLLLSNHYCFIDPLENTLEKEESEILTLSQ